MINVVVNVNVDDNVNIFCRLKQKCLTLMHKSVVKPNIVYVVT